MEKYGVYKIDAYGESMNGYDAVQMVNFTNNLNRIMIQSIKSVDSQESIHTFLKGLVKVFEAERGYIFTLNTSGYYDAVEEYVEPGYPSYKAQLQNVPETRFGHEWFDAFRADHGYIVTDMEAYQKLDPVMYEMLKGFQVEQIIACPMIYGGSLIGFVLLNNAPEQFLRAGTAILQLAVNYLSTRFRSSHIVGFPDETKHVDTVTGLYSANIFRRSFSIFLDSLRRGERTGQWAILHFNTFQFSAFNSSHGYEEGDHFLRELGQCIRRAIQSDYVTRTEADRFYAIVEAEKAELVVQSVHEEMQHRGSLSANIYAGIYIIDESCTEASRAMDRAKLAADAVEVDHVHYYKYFKPEMEEKLNLQSYLVNHVDEAVEKGWIKVYYQPVVSTLSKRVNGHEALSQCHLDSKKIKNSVSFKP